MLESIEPIAEIDDALLGRREVASDVRHHLVTLVDLPLEPPHALFPQHHAPPPHLTVVCPAQQRLFEG
jgi:hypothetical protein